MIYKQIHVKFLPAFLLLILPATILANDIKAEIAITISESTYYTLTTDNNDMSAPEMSAPDEVKEPVLVVTGNDSGKDGSTWFKGNGTYVYRLCTYWDGPWGGMASTELFRQRGSIRGLAVGEQLQFYISSASGSVTGSDDNAAVTVPIGDGLCETVYKYPGGGYTNREEPSSGLPASAFANAWLTRTGTGALLVIDGVPGAIVARSPSTSIPLHRASGSRSVTRNWQHGIDWRKPFPTAALAAPITARMPTRLPSQRVSQTKARLSYMDALNWAWGKRAW